MLQEGLRSNVDPRQGACIDESEVSVVNGVASKPLAGIIAKELVARHPFGLGEVSVQAILHCHSLEDGDHVRRKASGRHCWLMI